jgi:hypothetical protein
VPDTFFGFARVTSARLGVLPPILGSIEAWKARDGDRRVTLVHSRKDNITSHHARETYFSNVERFAADLADIAQRPAESGELQLLEVRHVLEGRIPLGVFEPVDGWPLRNVIGFVRCDAPLAAAIALAIAATYGGGPNIVTPDGRLVRQMLPHFSKIWRSETPSFIGNEPDISEEGRAREAQDIFASLSGQPTGDLATIAARLDGELGPLLARVLASRYSMTSPW